MRVKFGLFILLFAVALISAKSPANFPTAARQRLTAILSCEKGPQPVRTVNWLLRENLVNSVGPGNDGLAILIPRQPLYIYGFRVRTIEGWGTVPQPGGKQDAKWPFAMSAGAKTYFISVTLDGRFEDVRRTFSSKLPRTVVTDDHLPQYRASRYSGSVGALCVE